MIEGKCLCGSIRLRLKGELLYLYNCHCQQCRSFSGAAHATNASVAAADLEIVDTDGKLATYKTEGGRRHFCSNCGSSVYSVATGGEAFPTLHVGILSNPPAKGLDANIWVSEACPWVAIDEAVACYSHELD